MPSNASLLLDVSRLIWRRWAGRFPTGIDRVCLAYLEQYGPDALTVVQRRGWIRVLDREASQALFALLLTPTKQFRWQFLRLVASWPRRMVPPTSIRGALYLNIGHTGLEEPALARWIGTYRLRAVYFIHDLIPLTHPQYCRAGEADKHARRMDTVLASAAGVIGNSQQTIDDLARWAERRGQRMPPSQVALLGSDLVEVGGRELEATPSEAAYFVILGTIEGRKNHLLLLQIWHRMIADHGAQAPVLKIVGQRGWECEQVLDILDHDESLRAHVEELGRCTDAQVSALLSGARALLFPSLVEGYGLPLVEALRSGTPVIASDLAVFREIGGVVPDYLDPLDGPAWQAAILDFAQPSSKRRAAQMARLKNYRAPTWSDHFDAVDSWLSGL